MMWSTIRLSLWQQVRVFLCLCGASLTLPSAGAVGSPNFLFILADDQSWSGTSVRMHPDEPLSATAAFHTPNLQKLAAQDTTFSQAYAAHCKCECSRAAIQMGRTTTTLNAPDKSARNWSAPVTDSLANTLKKANPRYRAAHFGKWQWFHGPDSMGYDASDGITMNEDGDSQDVADPKQSFSMTRRAKAFMAEQVKSGHPFFLQMSYYAVHPQAQALAATLQKYQNMNPTAGGKGDRAIMAAMTEDLDACVGDLMRELDALKIADRTIIVYTSDNGGRTGLLNGGKGNLGEGGIRVPMIVRGAGIKAGSYCHVPVISYDLMPTILDFAGADSGLPAGVEGGSWRPLLLGDGVVSRPIDRMVWHQATEVDHPQSAIRQGDFKLLYFWDTRESMLFHLTKDLSESKNVASEHPDVAAKLEGELKSHIQAGLGEKAFSALERGEFSAGRKPAKGKGKAKGKK